MWPADRVRVGRTIERWFVEGFGLYFVGLGNTIPTQNIEAASTAQVVVVNDGRADFVVNPSTVRRRPRSDTRTRKGT